MSGTPMIEPLEGRTLFSAVGLELPSALPAAVILPARHVSHVLHLRGSISGPYTTPTLVADIGKHYALAGSGSVHPTGAATISGQIATPGFIATGIATGELTLSGASGSVTLTVKGPPENGFGPMPPRLAFSITSGTGRFKGAKGSGHISLRLDASTGTYTLKFQ